MEKAKRLEKMPQGPERDKLAEEIVAWRVRGEIVQPESKSKTFQQREAAIYARAYREIQQEIATYCTAKGIDLVLNDDSPASAPTPENADSSAARYIRQTSAFAPSGNRHHAGDLAPHEGATCPAGKDILTGAKSNSSTK